MGGDNGVRRDRSTLVSSLLGILGLAIAIYLTIVHYEERLLVCAVGNGGCETVQTSQWATIASIPIALLGVAVYLVLVGLMIVRRVYPELAFLATVAIAGITLAGVLYEIYLTYVEIWVIEAICQWCVAFAIVTLLLLLVESRRVWVLLNNDEAG